MTNAGGNSDRRSAIILLAVIVVGVLVTAGLFVSLIVLELPKMVTLVDEVFTPGLGLRTAAIIAAVISFLVLIAFAIVSGDGIIGELAFVIPGFFVFFLFSPGCSEDRARRTRPILRVPAQAPNQVRPKITMISAKPRVISSGMPTPLSSPST